MGRAAGVDIDALVAERRGTLAADPLLADPDDRVASLTMERPWAERLKKLLAEMPRSPPP